MADNEAIVNLNRQSQTVYSLKSPSYKASMKRDLHVKRKLVKPSLRLNPANEPLILIDFL